MRAELTDLNVMCTVHYNTGRNVAGPPSHVAAAKKVTARVAQHPGESSVLTSAYQTARVFKELDTP